MTKNELITLISDFSKHRNIFHSESDFQLEFGMYLIKNHFEVRLEKGFKQIPLQIIPHKTPSKLITNPSNSSTGGLCGG